MTNNDDSRPESGQQEEQQLGFDQDAFASSEEQKTRREPVFSGFEDDDEYEEPDRDTDHASAYLEEELEELEEYEGFEDDGADGQQDRDAPEDEPTLQDEGDSWPTHDQREEDSWDDAVDEEEEFDAEEDDPEDDEQWQQEYEQPAATWPIGLIAAAILAIVLLAAGGYGVMQQRSATQEEIRELRAQLATAAPTEQVAVDRSVERELKQRNVEMAMELESLRLENRRLSDTVKGLESQLDVQQKALARSKASKPAPKVTPKPAPAPAPAKTPAVASSGDWFVNFSSYSQRAAADDWAAKLKPSSGRSVVTTGSKDGRTIYRVRVVGLANRETAQKIAGQLESQYGLSKLWVGQQ